jgi:L-alanine-DL-glutamate epimerase-like enolase superfamily enzyme
MSAMRPNITKLECWVLRAPIAVPLVNAFRSMSNRPAYGWGEVFSNFPTVGAEHRARLIESVFAPLLPGTPSDTAAATRAMLEARTHRMAIQCGEPGPFAQIIGGIDQALWDMSARRAGEPLWKHLGGTSAKVRVYASGLGPDGVGEMALAKQAQGFCAFKLKVGFSRQRDRANTAELRNAVGAEATLMVDANQSWTPEQAVGEIEALAPFHLHWVEEPIAADEGMQAWRQLAARTGQALAAGENLRGLAAFDEAINAGYLRFIQPDVGKWGGISGCREVGQLAARKGIAFCPHWLAGGVGLAASMHLLAALGGEGYAEVDANPNPLREEVFPLRVDKGIATLSEAPGIGVEPDLARLKRYLVYP